MIYQPLLYDEKAILHLYLANQWIAYTNHPQSLFDGFKQSLYSYGAYDGDTLVGLIRVVGDGQTIIYIQDVLVHPDYHHKGIGTILVHHILKKYQYVRQIVLTTDNSTTQKAFYEHLGFIPYESLDLIGYYQKK